MFYRFVFVFLLFENAFCNLFSKGVVHYSVSPKDYDPHSQEIIISTLRKIQNEVCVKFFSIPVNYTDEKGDKVLHIHNPDKVKTCRPQTYDFSKSVIEMSIGYKCLNEQDITRMIVELLKASIHNSHAIINSEDLIKKFQEKERLDSGKMTLLAPNDRNYINAHYFEECGGLTQFGMPSRRMNEADGPDYTDANRNYYKDKTWPLGIVVFNISKSINNLPELQKVIDAMHIIEIQTCIKFHPANDDVLRSKNMIMFSEDGEEWPNLGFTPGTQTLKMTSIANPMSPGHSSHALMMIMRVLGIPMMSNRYDRDNFVKVHWNNVKKGSELYLEKTPEAAWLKQIPYDFTSVTHAPATFLCTDCISSYTVEPLQDHLWQRTLSMGRSKILSASDVKTVSTIYAEQCRNRMMLGSKIDGENVKENQGQDSDQGEGNEEGPDNDEGPDDNQGQDESRSFEITDAKATEKAVDKGEEGVKIPGEHGTDILP